MAKLLLAASLLCIAVCAFFASSVQACGMTTHNEMAHRATLYFENNKYPQYTRLVQQYPEAVQGGTPFPDWGYACGFHNTAEYTHWEPFLIAAVDYVRNKYPQPWDEETEKLVAFLMGIASHQIADINWHGLGEAYPRWSTPARSGFIEMLGALDFNCNGTLCSVAHNAADTGGEFVVASQFELPWLKDEWYVPIDDIVELYNLTNQKFDKTTIEECVVLFFTASHAVKDAGALLYPMFAKSAPFMVDQIQDHFIGGIDDNAVWTTWKWDLLADWIENGVPKVKKDTPSVAPPKEFHERRREVVQRLMGMYKNLPALKTITKEKSKRGLHLKATNKLSAGKIADIMALLKLLFVQDVAVAEETLSYSMKKATQMFHDCTTDFGGCVMKTIATGAKWIGDVIERKPFPLDGTDPTVLRGFNKGYEYFGSSIAHGDWNADGKMDMAVGAPGHAEKGMAKPQLGAVHIFEDLANPVIVKSLEGTDEYGRFGWSLATADMNADGIDDLIVGAPLAASKEFIKGYPHDHYRGKVFVFFGSKSGLSSQPNMTIVAQQDEEDAQLGYKLASGDIDGDGHDDLFIGSPFSWRVGINATTRRTHRGMLSVVLANKKYATGSSLSIDNADFRMLGDTDYELLGHEIVFVKKTATSGPMLLVSSPGYNAASGRVFGLVFSLDHNRKLVGKQQFVVTGDQVHSQMGASLAVGYPYAMDKSKNASVAYIAIGSPVEDIQGTDTAHLNAGVVRLIELGSIVGNVSLSNLTVRTTYVGDQPLGRLGYKVAMKDIDNDGIDELYIAQPFAMTLKGYEAGVAMLFADIPDGEQTDLSKAKWFASGLRGNSRLGINVMFADFNNDGLTDLIIGSSRLDGDDDTIKQTLSGAVSMYAMTK